MVRDGADGANRGPLESFAERARGAIRVLRGNTPPAYVIAPRERDVEADDRIAQDVLDLIMRMGEVLVSSGSPVAGVTATLLRVAAAYGLTSCQVDITFTSITVSVIRDDGQPMTAMRIVRVRAADYSRLEDIYLLADDAVSGLPLDTALDRLDEIVHAPHPYRRWLATAALAGMAVGVAGLLGGGWIVALIAAVATAIIDQMLRVLSRRALPSFFQHAVGAAFVSCVALVVALVTPYLPVNTNEVRPSLVVGSGIMVLLAGLGLVGAVQDAISGHYLTAAARNFEVLMQTVAIVIGVAVVLDVARRIGVDMSVVEQASQIVPSFALVPLGAVVAGFWAMSSYARWRASLMAALAGAVASAVFIAARSAELGPAVSSGAATLLVGAIADISGQRLKVPTLVIATAGVVPLLPGLAIYNAMSVLVGSSVVQGLALLLGAGTTGLALAAGVALGSFVARPLRRGVDRFDRRVRRWSQGLRD